MPERGPAPKRSDQRRRRNVPEAGEPTRSPGAEVVEALEPDPDWHPVAVQWFRSLAVSGQSAFYESSDWASAFVLAESMSRELHPQPVIDKDGGVTMVRMPPKAASVSAWLKGMTALLATEGDRRRAALELVRPTVDEEDDGDVSHLDDARRRLRGAG